MKQKLTKIIIFNFLVLISLILLIELFFGFWFDEFNFGPHMRGKRIQKIEINTEKKTNYYYRDFYGFRSDEHINEKYDTSKIKVVFNGGSSSDELTLNYDETIVGQLNKKLNDDKINHKIYNASLGGKSLIGHINEFDFWFKNIPNFNPKIIIYYIGSVDRKIRKDKWSDFNLSNKISHNLISIISQKSFFWFNLKMIKNKYFHNQDFNDYYTGNKNFLDKKNQNVFVSFDEATKLFNDSSEFSDILINYKKNLEKLRNKFQIYEIEPIFITQINYEVNGDEILFHLNNILKDFAATNDYKIFKLDEKISSSISKGFVDEFHTNELGSALISDLIYPAIKNELKILN